MQNELVSRVIFAIALAVLDCAGVFAQTPPAWYTPNIELTNAAYIRALARLPNGQIIVGGNDLQSVSGTPRSFLARLNANGDLDATWNPAPDGYVSALWVDAGGSVYVGGFFQHIAGQARAGLARFTSSGALDTTWAPSQNGGIDAISGGLSGTVCVGGTFTQIGGLSRNRLACLSDVDGSVVPGFAPDVNDVVSTLSSDGSNLYVGGYFTAVSGVTRTHAARLSLSGTGVPDLWNPAPNNAVTTILPTSNGIFLGGFFSVVGAITHAGIAKVNLTTGAAIATFDAAAGPIPADVLDLCSDGSGGLVVVGNFSSIGGQSRTNIARLDGTTGNAITTFAPSIDYGYATHIVAEPSGSFLVAGPFSSLDGGEHLGAGRVLSDGNIDPNFDTSLEAQGHADVIANLPTPGAFIVGGDFVRANGLTRRNLFKLATPSVVDPNWIANTDAEVRVVTIDSIGRVYVAGYFTQVDKQPRNYIARLQNTSDGALDTAWNSTAAAYAIYSMVLRPEGLYAAGVLSPQPLLRLKVSDGSTDTAWSPQFDSSVYSIASVPDGALIASGAFTTVNGSPRTGLAKLSTGSSAILDTSWTPTLVGSASVVAVNDNNVYISGSFTSVDGSPRNGLAKLSGVGAGPLDAAWKPSITGNASQLLPTKAGIYVAGFFTDIDAGGHAYLARIDDVTGALDPTWTSSVNNWVLSLTSYRNAIMAAGWFTSIGGDSRQAVARLPIAGDTIFVDDLDG